MTAGAAALWRDPATRARVLPFAAFMVVLALRGLVPEGGTIAGVPAGWLYALQAGAAALLLAVFWRHYGELRRWPTWPQTAIAVAVGLVVCWLWVALDAPWMRLGTPTNVFNPLDADGRMQWGLLAVRWTGAALVVPLMEELFWRSFLMRWAEQPAFEQVDPRRVGLRAVLLATGVFTLAHTEWLGAVVAGLAYAALYIRTGSLWTAVIAHAVTNGVLGAWVIWGGHWAYW